MIKGFLIVIIFLLGVGLSEIYVKEFQKLKNISLVKSELKGVELRIYGEKGLEWKIYGKKLLSVGKNVEIESPTILTEGYRIISQSLSFNKANKKGVLKGETELFGEDLYVKTKDANIDFNKGVVWGKERIFLKRKGNVVKGRGFTITFKPFKVIINEVESTHPAT